jgi:hypothetical protein
MVRVPWRINAKQNNHNTPKKIGVMTIKNKCWIVSGVLQKQQVLPIPIPFSKIVVSTTPSLRTK